MPNSPAMKRKLVCYDLNEAEREKLKALSDEDNRSVSRWMADAVRVAMQGREVKPRKGKK